MQFFEIVERQANAGAMRLNRITGCGGGHGAFDLNGDGACSMGNYGGFLYIDGRPIGFEDNGEHIFTDNDPLKRQ